LDKFYSVLLLKILPGEDVLLALMRRVFDLVAKAGNKNRAVMFGCYLGYLLLLQFTFIIKRKSDLPKTYETLSKLPDNLHRRHAQILPAGRNAACGNFRRDYRYADGFI
jgi:hypothetical protein